MEPINICIADDQVLFRQGIVSLIKDIPGFNLVFEAGDGAAFLEKMKSHMPLPQVALVDVEMPGMDGIELNSRLQADYPELKVIMLSVHSQPRLIARMIHSGACGYLLKNCDKEEVTAAIRSAHTKGFYVDERTLSAIQQTAVHNPVLRNEAGIEIDLTLREKEVLRLICEQFTNGEIAQQLFLSTRTVDGHRNNLLAKTGCRNTAGLVLFAIRHHIFEVHF